MTTLRCIVAVTIAAGCVTSACAQTAVDALRARVAAVPGNAASIYWQGFDSLTNLTASQRAILGGATNATPEEADALSRAIQPALRAMEGAAGADVCDWGVDYSAGPAALLPHLMPSRTLVQAAAWEAGRMAQSDAARAVDLTLMGVGMSRRLESDTTLIASLVGVACDKLTVDRMARLLPNLPEDQLKRIAAALGRSAPDERWRRSMQSERDLMAGWFIGRILEMARTNSSDQAVVGLPSGTNSLSRDLRLSAMVLSETRIRVGLDDVVNKRNFWLTPGKTNNGITLVSADFANEEAVISRGGEMAVLHLKGLEIVPFEYKFTPAQLASFREMLGGAEGASDADLMVKIGGPKGVVDDLLELQKIESDWASLSGWKSSEELSAMQEAAAKRLGPMSRLMLPPLASSYETLFAGQVREQMMRAAIGLRLGDGRALAAYPDPADGKPFEVRKTAGGYELISRASQKGKPVIVRVGP